MGRTLRICILLLLAVQQKTGEGRLSEPDVGSQSRPVHGVSADNGRNKGQNASRAEAKRKPQVTGAPAAGDGSAPRAAMRVQLAKTRPLPYLFDSSRHPPVETACAHCATLQPNFNKLRRWVSRKRRTFVVVSFVVLCPDKRIVSWATRSDAAKGVNKLAPSEWVCCGVCQMDNYYCASHVKREVSAVHQLLVTGHASQTSVGPLIMSAGCLRMNARRARLRHGCGTTRR